MTIEETRAAYPHRVRDTLGEAEHDGSVWRCSACTMTWVGGAWFRLSTFPTVMWTLIIKMPEGPFYELKDISYDDYRNRIFKVS